MDVLDELLLELTEDERHFLTDWYRLDDDIELPCYVLRPVREVIPGFAARDRDVYKDSYREWKNHMVRIRNLLCRPEKADLYATYLVSGASP